MQNNILFVNSKMVMICLHLEAKKAIMDKQTPVIAVYPVTLKLSVRSETFCRWSILNSGTVQRKMKRGIYSTQDT